ncbi:MAG TPA: hypothetical protein VF192_04060 [Longimicrobiales bacterium]
MWTVSETPRRRHGAEGQGPSHELYQVRGAYRLSDGRLVVANAGSRELRFYDGTGEYLGSAGRKGEEPGEFRWIDSLFVVADDSLVVVENTRGPLLTVLDREGTYRRSFRLGVDRSYWVVGVFSTGEVVAMSGDVFRHIAPGRALRTSGSHSSVSVGTAGRSAICPSDTSERESATAAELPIATASTQAPAMPCHGEPDRLSAMNRTTLAVAVTVAANAVLAWWLKGDWEMGWLLWMTVVPVAGGALGLLAAAILRGRVEIVMPVGFAAGVVALWAAIATPHQWAGTDLARTERRAAALADSTHHVEARVRELLGAGVEVSGVQPTVAGGRVRKRPLRFLLEREPAVARLSVTFALGPARPLVLRLEGDSLTAPAAALDSARAAPWVIREAALARRFPAPALTVGGHGPWPPGDVVGVRVERGESDWSLLLVRVGGAAGLETVREVSGAESRAGLVRAAALAGRPVRDVRIYLSRGAGVTYLPAGRFDFIGLPEDRRASLRLVARVEGDEVRYETADWFDP